MVTVLYLISGAVAAGKTTIARSVADRLPNLVLLEEDRRPATTGEERLSNLEQWIEDALALEAKGKDAVFGSQSPLGEVLASPRAVDLEGIAPCLLDAHDFVRMDRWVERGVHPEWPIGMDHFCWAAFHRLHARDPQFEQRVMLDRAAERSIWSRWTDWTADDPRWDIFICDTSTADLETTIGLVSTWIERVRNEGTPIMRTRRWWNDGF
jgi:hypothetical protein